MLGQMLVMEFQSLCIFSCILTLLIILIKPLTSKAHDRRASGDCGTSGYRKGPALIKILHWIIIITVYRNILVPVLLCGQRSIAAHRDHFVRRLSVHPSVCPSVCLSGSHTFLVVTHSYVLQVTHASLRMLPLFFFFFWMEGKFKIGNWVNVYAMDS